MEYTTLFVFKLYWHKSGTIPKILLNAKRYVKSTKNMKGEQQQPLPKPKETTTKPHIYKKKINKQPNNNKETTYQTKSEEKPKEFRWQRGEKKPKKPNIIFFLKPICFSLDVAK